MRTTIRVAGTALVAVLLTYPLWAPAWGMGLLGEVWAVGWPGALTAVLCFFGLVALYCGALYRTLTLVRPEASPVRAASVWWMFAIPYNFTEDFFIVSNVAAAVRADGRLQERPVMCWLWFGYGWCAFQILSLFPGAAGFIGGAIAVPLWIVHWVLTVRVNKALSTPATGEAHAVATI